ncbi:N-acetylmuramic acid 6-phosphate etherase [Ketogulonicigenium robustum]|uniref:N-acetylmuramic acid 6-phosphate etherase n=1 Tax=Ketogulonicigenium robustum TaxID=92947 RepID=A0A1W6P2E9_9RHOB|nr:N-acetylmuramic acid 6-phosphate etherase [Ketogulonicigenium robustum]ARO15467.1 N-acetylmuramic acid 6-phosphate etherase [Ketogulonicigenium robustum]
MSTTEAAARRFADLESWPTTEVVDAMVEGQMAAIAAIAAAKPVLAAAIDAAAENLQAGGRLVYLGAGTSGRLGTLDAAELPPTFSWPYARAISIMAGGPAAITHAVEGAEDSRTESVDALKALDLNATDVVIGIAASGNTPFVVAGLEYANQIGAITISVYNNAFGKVGEVAQFPLMAATGAEVIAGSTRMKAGTAQKALLTCLSSGIFVRMGYVYHGRMVEMRPTNIKLQARAELMVAELADASLDDAAAALAAAGGEIKVAVVMLLRNEGPDAARMRLEQAQGRLHVALS